MITALVFPLSHPFPKAGVNQHKYINVAVLWKLTLNHQKNTVIRFLSHNPMKKRYYTRNYPASMFDATGMIRMDTKSTLNNDLRLNVSGRSFGN